LPSGNIDSRESSADADRRVKITNHISESISRDQRSREGGGGRLRGWSRAPIKMVQQPGRAVIIDDRDSGRGGLQHCVASAQEMKEESLTRFQRTIPTDSYWNGLAGDSWRKSDGPVRRDVIDPSQCASIVSREVHRNRPATQCGKRDLNETGGEAEITFGN
jgi:hypothetical protein